PVQATGSEGPARTKVHPTTAPPAPICGMATRFISPAYIAQGDAAASMPTANTICGAAKRWTRTAVASGCCSRRGNWEEWPLRRCGYRAGEPFREPAGPFRVRTGGEHRELGRAEAADHIRQPRGRFDRLHGAAQVHPTRWLDVEREHDAGEWTVLPERLRSELP